MRTFFRGVDEGLVIGEHVEVKVLELREGRVLLGITRRNEPPYYWEEELVFDTAEESAELQIH